MSQEERIQHWRRNHSFQVTSMNRTQGLHTARRFRRELEKKGFPIQQVFLFGSVARDEAKETSDIDLAVLCTPFLASRHDENVEFLLTGAEIDRRIETICLHPEDLQNEHWILARDIQKEGIAV